MPLAGPFKPNYFFAIKNHGRYFDQTKFDNLYLSLK